MDETVKYLIATCIGGVLTLLGNYLLEDRRLKNEKFKYKIDKIVTVGEEYYKLSAYKLIYFISLIDTMNKRENYMSEGGQNFLNFFDNEYKKQLNKIRENNIVITTASLYFDVTDSEKAVAHMLLLKDSQLKMQHVMSNQDVDLYNQGYIEYTQVIESIISEIKTDQMTISTKIKKILNPNDDKAKKVPRFIERLSNM